jgi:hypothetical protein
LGEFDPKNLSRKVLNPSLRGFPSFLGRFAILSGEV